MTFLIIPVLVAVLMLLAFRRLRPGAEQVVGATLVGRFGVVFALAWTGVLANFELPPKIPLIALGAVVVGLLVALGHVAAILKLRQK